MSYVQWYKRYVYFQKEVCGKMRHPAEMGAPEVEAFLTHLAVNRDLAAASQNQVLNALEPLGWSHWGRVSTFNISRASHPALVRIKPLIIA